MIRERVLISMSILGAFAYTGCATPPPPTHKPKPAVYCQAHRGGLREVPENTMTAFRHAWGCPGAVPEADVRTTKDGVLVCIHDETPKRTTTAPAEFRDMAISEITFEQLRQWDAGVRFNRKYKGEKVPALTEVFEEMKGRPDRQVYLDVKGADFKKLAALIAEYGLNNQVIFVHGDQEKCIELSQLFPGARTMTWLSGTPDEIKGRFERMAEETGFKGLSQIQFHLRTTKPFGDIEYVIDEDYLRHAYETAKAAGVELQLRPFRFDKDSMRRLIDIGVRWYVTDEPRRFADAVYAK